MAIHSKLTVTINSPDKLIWQGQADSFSSENSAGPFDILPQHANFLTIVEKKPIIISSGGKTATYSFARCVIYANNDYVSCFAV